VTAKIRDKESAGWGLVVRLVDPDGQDKQIIVPWRDLNVTSGEKIRSVSCETKDYSFTQPGRLRHRHSPRDRPQH
jgi:hypothetical protein